MTLEDLADLARKTREWQKRYFRTHSNADLGVARDWERRLDSALEKLAAGPGLFDQPPEGKLP